MDSTLRDRPALVGGLGLVHQGATRDAPGHDTRQLGALSVAEVIADHRGA
jgi:hypothetical protein